MLIPIKKISAFLLSIATLSLFSGCCLFYAQLYFIEKLYRQTLLDEFLIALLFISVTAILFIISNKTFLKQKLKNVLIQGLFCMLLEVFLFLLSISVFFDWNRFLMHFIAVSIYCFFIPYTYDKFGRII